MTDKPQFLLFGGDDFYPRGGWEDIVTAGTLEECKAAFVRWDQVGSSFDWAHIVNLETLTIEMIAQGDGSGVVKWAAPTADDFWRYRVDTPMSEMMRKMSRWPEIDP